METMVKLTLRIPARLHKRLKQRASLSNQSLNTTILEAIEDSISQNVTSYETQEDKLWRKLRESGLWEPLGPEWQKYIEDAPNLTHAEMREMLKGVPPLSEIIIEERGPRE
jgi:hypothetical protein